MKRILNAFVFILSTAFLFSCNRNQTNNDSWKKEHGVIPVYNEFDDTITYGMYPQTHILDEEFIDILNKLTPSVCDNKYVLFRNEYYYKVESASPCSKGDRFDDGSLIIDGKSYWFKVEPITWRILKVTEQENTDKYFLTSNKLLVNHNYGEYYEVKKEKTDYEGNKDTVYANNYKYSDLRTFLNTSFLNQAFFLGDSRIIKSEVDNSSYSTEAEDNPYCCEATNDKLFALSYSELYNEDYGFKIDNDRTCKTTDFARAIGTYNYMDDGENKNNGIYLMRSPDYNYSYRAGMVFESGFTTYTGLVLDYLGVRPCLNIIF